MTLRMPDIPAPITPNRRDRGVASPSLTGGNLPVRPVDGRGEGPVAGPRRVHARGRVADAVPVPADARRRPDRARVRGRVAECWSHPGPTVRAQLVGPAVTADHPGTPGRISVCAHPWRSSMSVVARREITKPSEVTLRD